MIFSAEGGNNFSIDPSIVDLTKHPGGAYIRYVHISKSYEVTPFRSIPHCFWWVATTMTTVGYGDFYPTSGPGWFIGVMAFFGGIMTVALPTTIIGAEFAELYLSWVEDQDVAR